MSGDPDANQLSELHAEGLRRNRSRILILAFCQVFLVIMPIAVPFFQSKGLSMQEVFVLQALFGLMVVVLEVPSGYIADVLGRRSTLIIGGVFSGIGHTTLIFAEGFWGLLVFEACLAIAHSLVSGADIALIYDTELTLAKRVGRADAARSERERQVVGKLFSARTSSEGLAGIVCSLLLVYGTMEWAVWVQALVGWLPLMIGFGLTEPPLQKLIGTSHWANIVGVVKHLWSDSRVLRLCFLALSIWSLTTFYAVWLIQKLWDMQGLSLVHFGYLWAGLSLLASLAGRYAQVVEDWIGSTALVLLVGLAPMLCYVLLAQNSFTAGLVAAAGFFISRGLGYVVLKDALNARVPSETRATANSVASFTFRAIFVITGPLVGYVFDLYGMDVTLWLLVAGCGVICLALMVPLALAVRRPPNIREGQS